MKKIILLGTALCLLMLVLVGCDGEPIPLDVGGAHLWIDRAEIIEIVSEYSLIVEIVPRIIQGEEHGIEERPNEFTLIVGDVVEAIFANDDEYSISTIAGLNVGDIIQIGRFNVPAAIDYQNSPIVLSFYYIEIDNDKSCEWPSETRQITLDDIRLISHEINVNLTLYDLREFTGTDIGHGIFIMQYFVENSDFILTVGSSNTVQYALLTHAVDGGANDSIDIRFYDVDKFIADGTIELVRPLPEADTLPLDIPNQMLNYAAFLELLESSGFTFEEAYTNPPDWLSVGTRIIRIGDELITIYEYDSNEAMENDSVFISPSGFSIERPDPTNEGYSFGVEISWVSWPYWFKRDYVIVLYVGENRLIIDILTEIFGNNFAGHGR